MIEPNWISKSEVLAIHAEQVMQHGGPSGVRDETLLESALARPRNLLAYGEPDLAELASSYAFGIARNHPFVDGNKRTSYVVCLTFLGANAQFVKPEPKQAIATWLALADGSLAERDLASWLRSQLSAPL